MKSNCESESGRIPGIDMLRGVCLVEMMANHLPANLLTSAARETLGFISAAEGFVFLSGFVAGWLSRKIDRRQGPPFVRRRFLGRAAELYAIYCLILTSLLGCLAFGGHRFDGWARLLDLDGKLDRAWIFAITFVRQPQYLDIFPMYCLFVLLVPLIIAQLRAGRKSWVMAASAILWTGSQFWTGANPFANVHLGYFNLFSWQLLFTAGVILGYQKEARPGATAQPTWAIALSSTLCVVLLVVKYMVRLNFYTPDGGLAALVEKPTLGLARLINFAALACMVQAILRLWGAQIARTWVSRQLAFLGQHSLAVFSWSVVITYFSVLSGDSWRDFPMAAQVGVAAVPIVSLWLAAAVDARFSGMHFASMPWSRSSTAAPTAHFRLRKT